METAITRLLGIRHPIAYGAKVVATVTNERHARAAERYGCDAVQVVGLEAAGHGGTVTSLVLIPAIVDAVRIPVIASGVSLLRRADLWESLGT